MIKHLYVTFDETETPLFNLVHSPSILSASDSIERPDRTKIVGRAACGEALNAKEIRELKLALEGAVEDREGYVEEARSAGDEHLAVAFAGWLAPLGEAWGLACKAEAVLAGGLG